MNIRNLQNFCLFGFLSIGLAACSYDEETSDKPESCSWIVNGNEAVDSCGGYKFQCAGKGFTPKIIPIDYEVSDLSRRTNLAFPRCTNSKGEISLYVNSKDGYMSQTDCNSAESGKWFEVHYIHGKKWSMCEDLAIGDYGFRGFFDCNQDNLSFESVSYPSLYSPIPRCFYKDTDIIYMDEDTKDSPFLSDNEYVVCAEEEQNLWFEAKRGQDSFLLQCDGNYLTKFIQCDEDKINISDDRLSGTCESQQD